MKSKTEGDSMDEVINNLQDAIQGWLEVANELQEPIIFPISYQ